MARAKKKAPRRRRTTLPTTLTREMLLKLVDTHGGNCGLQKNAETWLEKNKNLSPRELYDVLPPEGGEWLTQLAGWIFNDTFVENIERQAKSDKEEVYRCPQCEHVEYAWDIPKLKKLLPFELLEKVAVAMVAAEE